MSGSQQLYIIRIGCLNQISFAQIFDDRNKLFFTLASVSDCLTTREEINTLQQHFLKSKKNDEN